MKHRTGIPLTGELSQTIVNWMGRSAVPRCDQQASRRNVWQWCVPALLVVLLLYNPFLALTMHSDGLAYQAQARHRSTVGSSELQHYSPVQGDNAQVEVTVEAIFFGRIVENAEKRFHFVPNDPLPQRPELDTTVWFRPPPAA